ncbi:MAG TPA: hypothetical protein VGJ91_23585 [Polyangiaceae bacterium]
MTDVAQNEIAHGLASAPARGRFQLGPFGALLIASAIAGLAAWLLFLPARAPARLVRPEPRPALLDKPHRHRAAPEPSTAPPVR